MGRYRGCFHLGDLDRDEGSLRGWSWARGHRRRHRHRRRTDHRDRFLDVRDNTLRTHRLGTRQPWRALKQKPCRGVGDDQSRCYTNARFVVRRITGWSAIVRDIPTALLALLVLRLHRLAAVIAKLPFDLNRHLHRFLWPFPIDEDE